MTNINFEDLFDENGRRIEWYDEDFSSEFSAGTDFAYTDEFPMTDDDCDPTHDYDVYDAALFLNELVTLCLEMNTADELQLVSLVSSVYYLLYYVSTVSLDLYAIMEKNYVDYACSNGLFFHYWEAIA